MSQWGSSEPPLVSPEAGVSGKAPRREEWSGVGASDAALGPFDIQRRLRRLWTQGMSMFSLA